MNALSHIWNLLKIYWIIKQSYAPKVTIGDVIYVFMKLYISLAFLLLSTPVLYHNLHNIFPTVLIEDLKQLDNKDELRKKIENVEKKRDSSRKYLDFNYWKDMILEEAKKLK